MSNRLGLPYLGDGVGLRPVHYSYLYNIPERHWGVDWFEAISEDFFDGRGPMLDFVRAARPVVLHGVSLNVGSTDPVDFAYLRKLSELIDRVSPAWVSDHMCWTGVDGYTSHDLWPLPRTPDSVAHVVDRVKAVQDYLQRPIVLENPSSYLEFAANRMPEPEFLAKVVDLTGCGLLLDVNNVFVSSVNHGFDPVAYIDAVPADAIVYVHVAGHTDHGHYRIDSHDRPVADEVWSLYARVWQRTGGVSTLLEWDSDIPPFPDVVVELSKASGCRDSNPGPPGPEPGALS